MKLNRIISFSLLVTTLFLNSCTEPEETAIMGVIENGSVGEKIFLWELKVAKAAKIDSVTIGENGYFNFDPTPMERTFYRITRSNNEGILISIDSTENVKLNINSNNFTSDYSISGSKESAILKELGSILEGAFIAKDSLNQEYQANYNNMTEELMLNFQQRLATIESGLRDELGQFINKYPGSISTLVAIENLDMDQNQALYKLVDENVGANYSESSYFQVFHQKFLQSSKLTEGKVVPDIALPNPDGEVKMLSSLRGKTVLIDFWASWCKPCRAENPNVVRLYNKYKGEDFEIFGVSLDRNREAWLQAIQSDGLEWMHVSDLKLWQSAVVKLYNIRAIPLTILIDENGVIIAKNLRGKDLENKLEELFGES